MVRCCCTVHLFAAAAGFCRGISALLHGACKLFARKCYLRLPKGAAAFLPSAAIVCSKPVFIIDAASAVMLYATVIQLISVVAFLLQLLYVLHAPWQPAEGFAAVSPLVSPLALQPRQPSLLPPRLQCSGTRMPGRAPAGKQLLVKALVCQGALGGVLGCTCLRQSNGAHEYFAKLLENSC